MDGRGNWEILAKRLVGSRHKSLVLDERPSSGHPELNAPERRGGPWWIKEILRIEDLVAVEEKCGTVEVIRRRTW